MDYDELRERLPIDGSALDEEVSRQPVLMMAAHELYAQAYRQLSEAKQAVDEAEAHAYRATRESLESSGEKVTEARIQQTVRMDVRLQDSRRAVRDAQEHVHRCEGLVRAYQQRGSMLRDLVQLYVTEYYSTDSIKMDPVDRVKLAHGAKRP